MSRSTQPTFEQVRALHRLIGDARAATADLTAQGRLLVDGACRLLGADQGFFAQFADWRVGRVPRGVNTVHGSVQDARVAAFTAQFYREQAASADAMGAAMFDATAAGPPTTGAFAWSDVRHTRKQQDYPAFYALLDEMQFVDILDPAATSADASIVTLSLHRLGKRAKAFGAREKLVAALLAQELKWLRDTGRLALLRAQPATDAPDLTPRLAAVYRLLLTDRSAKQIAADLGLSVHTARDYIDQVYKRIGVSSREELLVRFLRP
jgi:DNA-binding CsgD family transcriptional regulator